MTSSQLPNGATLFSEADLDEMIVEIESARTIPNARDAFTEFREFRGWTLNKLDVLEMYLRLYRRVAGGGTYLDAFAGTGLGVDRQHGRNVQRDGSSIIAAKSGAFSSLHLVELDPENFSTLTQTVDALPSRLSNKIVPHPGDCNQIIPRLLQEDRIDSSRPCFALFDQESTQLRWKTIEELANWKKYEPPATMTGRPKMCKAEMWILFNSHQVIHRLWPHDRIRYPDSLSPETLDRVFGCRNAWWDLWENHEPANSLVRRFAEQLTGLGYQYVLPQLINDPTTGSPQYHMIHATDHPSAVSLMRWAKRRTDGYENQHLPGI